MRAAASRYVEQLRPDHENALVVSFDESVLLHQGVTADRDRLIEAIARVRMGHSTSMLDGLYYVVRELSTHRERPVVLLLTDGVDTTSLYERDDVRRLAASRPDLSVFSIGLGLPQIQSSGPSGLNSSKRFLQRLSAATNGKFFDVPTGGRLDRVYTRIREMLDNEAILTVTDPRPEAKPGTLTVRSANRIA